MRIVFFGDSLTEGIPGASYLRLLQARAQADAALRGVELINAGVGGDTVRNLARRLAHDVAPLAPDWVVILIGTNDCTTALLRLAPPLPRRFSTRRYFREVKGVREAITPARFTEGLRIVVDGLRERTNAQIALCTPPIYDRWNTWTGAFPSRLLDRYTEAVRWVGAERNCPVIDVRAAVQDALAMLPPRPLLAPLLGLRANFQRDADIETLARMRGYRFTFDGVHLTAAGAKLVADTIYEWLCETVSEASMPPLGNDAI